MSSVIRPIAIVGSIGLTLGFAGCMPGNPTSESSRTGAGAVCQSPEAVICDGDDNNNQTSVVDGRGGYWYTFVDDLGTTVWPTAGAHGGTFEMTPGGAENSPYAAHFKGQIAPAGEPLFSGMGLNFLDPKGGYDASKYGGISFWAKKGPGSTGKVRLKVPDSYTDPDGGNCSECFNDGGADLTLTEQWQLFTFPFKALKQMPGWGRPKRMKVDAATVYGIQFQVNDPGQPYDIWVDQIRFTGCQ